jgi:predicted dehydrogenase
MASRLSTRLSRRTFAKTVSAAAAVSIMPVGLARGSAANERISVGVIGVGGRGGSNLNGVSKEHVAALCDVDRRHLEGAGRRFADAHRYTDFREMLDKEKSLDAVVISTPDHTHAAAAIRAMRQGLHCYCEKPLTQTVTEARQMAELAAAKKLSTQMGTPAPGTEDAIRTAELLRAGVLGDVTEIHLWSDRPIWPQGFSRPAGEDPVPETLDWECFIGPAPMRPYKDKWPEGHPLYALPEAVRRNGSVYHPFVWRGWWDFGTGVLGDIGAHAWNAIWMGLELDAPTSVEPVAASGPTDDMFPLWSVTRFDFAARGKRAAVKIYWYDGTRIEGWKQPPADLLRGTAAGQAGSLIVGSRATMGTGNRGPGDFADVPKTLPRPEWPADEAMYQGWLRGIRTGSRPVCPFDYAGPLTEALLLGNIAMKTNQKVEWNPAAMQVTNNPSANRYLARANRAGWEL